YFREVAAGLTLNIDRDSKEPQILMAYSANQIIGRGGQFKTKRDLVCQNSELAADGVFHYARNKAQGNAEGMAGAQASDNNIESVGELLAKARNSFTPDQAKTEIDDANSHRDGKR